jgi:hypothetical protein
MVYSRPYGPCLIALQAAHTLTEDASRGQYGTTPRVDYSGMERYHTARRRRGRDCRPAPYYRQGQASARPLARQRNFSQATRAPGRWRHGGEAVRGCREYTQRLNHWRRAVPAPRPRRDCIPSPYMSILSIRHSTSWVACRWESSPGGRRALAETALVCRLTVSLCASWPRRKNAGNIPLFI